MLSISSASLTSITFQNQKKYLMQLFFSTSMLFVNVTSKICASIFICLKINLQFFINLIYYRSFRSNAGLTPPFANVLWHYMQRNFFQTSYLCQWQSIWIPLQWFWIQLNHHPPDVYVRFRMATVWKSFTCYEKRLITRKKTHKKCYFVLHLLLFTCMIIEGSKDKNGKYLHLLRMKRRLDNCMS